MGAGVAAGGGGPAVAATASSRSLNGGAIRGEPISRRWPTAAGPPARDPRHEPEHEQETMSTRTSLIGIGRDHPRYKWIALSNTTLGSLLATINLSIVLISLPAIFRGIKVNPLAPSEIDYLLWVLLSYMVVTAVLVVTAGRISDMLGRVRMYKIGRASCRERV